MGKGWWAKLGRRERYAVILWLTLNIADSLLTYIIVYLGGVETGLVYRITDSMMITTIAKYACVVLIALILAKLHRLQLLYWLTLPVVLVVWLNARELILHLIA